MKTTFLKSIVGTVLALLMLVGGTYISASGQISGQFDGGEERNDRRSLVGAWRVVLTPRNCTTRAALGGSFRGLYTFHKGGTMSEWLTNSFVLPTLRSPGHGVWQRDGSNSYGLRSYTYSIIFNRYNASGIITGSQIGRAELVLGESGNDYTTNSTVQIFDTEDNPVGSPSCSTIEGTRFE